MMLVSKRSLPGDGAITESLARAITFGTSVHVVEDDGTVRLATPKELKRVVDAHAADQGRQAGEDVLHELKVGTLHSGSPTGPKVKSRITDRAIAI